jgi:hypothetical protein
LLGQPINSRVHVRRAAVGEPFGMILSQGIHDCFGSSRGG